MSHSWATEMITTLRIAAYLRLSRHGIYYFRIIVPMALRSRWRGRPEIKISLKTRDLRQALVRARDLAEAALKNFEYANGVVSAKPFNPNDQSTWPSANEVRKFEKTIETVCSSGQVDRVHYKVDPNSPADIAAAEADQTKHYVRQRLFAKSSGLQQPRLCWKFLFFFVWISVHRRKACNNIQNSS